MSLPVVLVTILLVLQVGLVVRDGILVVHAAREAARVAAVDADPDAPRRAVLESGSLDARRVSVQRGPRLAPGSIVRVTVEYRTPSVVPLVGALVDGLELKASAAMRVE